MEMTFPFSHIPPLLPSERILAPEEALNSFGDFEQGLVRCLRIDALLGKLALTAT